MRLSEIRSHLEALGLADLYEAWVPVFQAMDRERFEELAKRRERGAE